MAARPAGPRRGEAAGAAGGRNPPRHRAGLLPRGRLSPRDTTLQELQEAARADPRLPFVHFYLGIAYRRQNDFARAKTEFLRDLTVDPGAAYTYDELGAVCSFLEQNREAAQYYREALRRDPRLASSYYGLGKIDLRENDFAAALAALDRAAQLDPESASVHYLKARVLLALGRRGEAQSEFAAAARLQKAVRDELQREISGAKLPNPELGAQ
ncbi:MAG: tetratricopeptide repeat protein [Terriglobia bacterium]